MTDTTNDQTGQPEIPELTREEILAAHIEAGIDAYDAVEVLHRYRHHLSPDILRSLQCIWFCASAARYGEPYEDFTMPAAAYAEHNVAECEDENGDDPEAAPGFMIEQFCDDTERSNAYVGNFDPAEDTEEFLAWIAAEPGRTAAWTGIRNRYGRTNQELIAGALKQNPALGCWETESA